jgi:hypothetical protein
MLVAFQNDSLHCLYPVFLILQQKLLHFACPQGCSVHQQQQQQQLFITGIYLLPSISLA